MTHTAESGTPVMAGDYDKELGQGVCRTCAKPIWWEAGEIGRREGHGWSDRIKRGGDSLVCFSAVNYRHVPLTGREAAIYDAGFKAGSSVTPPGAIRLGSCCINVGTDECACENPTNYGLDTRVTPPGGQS